MWVEKSGRSRVGKLELRPERVRLAGAVEREIPYGEIVGLHVGRSTAERIGERPSLVLDLAGGRSLRIGSVGAPGTLHELAERLNAATAHQIPA